MNIIIDCLLNPLFIKPLYYPGGILYTRYSPQLQKEISFRSMNLDTDLEMIHQWVNMDYTQKFWRLEGSSEKLYNLYYSIQRNSNGHSYIGLLDGSPVCQLDVYRVMADEINATISSGIHDCGFHLMMAPNKHPVKGLTVEVVKSFLFHFFSFNTPAVMYAEPDIRNQRSNQLLQRLGFEYLYPVKMSYKEAYLYSITKQKFYETWNVNG